MAVRQLVRLFEPDGGLYSQSATYGEFHLLSVLNYEAVFDFSYSFRDDLLGDCRHCVFCTAG